jgi:hypothetical protein
LKHCFREQVTDNADPARTPDNTHHLAASVEEAQAAFAAALPPVGKRRKNGVIAIEYLITASPEAMKAKSRAKVDAYFDASLAWLRRRHGAENIMVATIHRDETTPHLSCFVVPRDGRGKMNARHFCGGADELSIMQTDFAENVGAKHGLVRGILKSGARHQTIRSYYASLRKAEEERARAVDILSTQNDLSVLKRSQGHISQEIHDAVLERSDLVVEVERLRKANTVLERQVAAQANSIAKLRASEVREIRLPTVLAALGGSPVSESELKWSTPRGDVHIDPDNPRSFKLAGKRGYNAIDLVMSVDGVSFEKAVGWLLALQNPETTAERLVGDAAYAAGERAKIMIEHESKKRDAGESSVLVNVDRSAETVESVCVNLHAAFKLAPDILNSQTSAGRLAGVQYGDDLHAAFQMAPTRKTEPGGWVIACTDTGREWVRGRRGPFQIVVEREKDAAKADTIIAYTGKTLDAIALATAFRRGAIYKRFKRLIAVATNGMAFEELRGLVKDLASLGRAAIAEFARNDSGKTIAGHLTRAIKEESIKVDNKGIVRPPFPENCVRWTDVLKNWELFLAATEKAEMAASKRERDENSKSGIERE